MFFLSGNIISNLINIDINADYKFFYYAQFFCLLDIWILLKAIKILSAIVHCYLELSLE